jgi:hypothetical protein
MAKLGVMLMPHKEARVLSPELIAALGDGVQLVPLDPAAADFSSWLRADAILHKVPTDPGVLLLLLECARHAQSHACGRFARGQQLAVNVIC